jgi:hypothetical protein
MRARGPSAVVVVLLVAAAAAACGDDKERLTRSPARDGGPRRGRIIIDKSGLAGIGTVPEQEPNDTAGAAQAVELPGGVSGAIDKSGDEDVYAVRLAVEGTLAVRLSAVDDADLILEVHDGTGQVLAASDNGPAKTEEGVPNVSVQPGTYRLVVKEYVKKPDKGKKLVARAAPSATYRLTVASGPAPAEGEEVEPNDEDAFAGDLAVGGSAMGFVGWRKDRDAWKVPLDAVGDDQALSIDVDGVTGVALSVSVRDGTGAALLQRVGRTGEGVAIRNVAARPGEPYYFVAVSGNRGNLDERYTIRVSAAALELDDEAEPNDTPETAGPLSDIPGAESGMRVGYLGRADVDTYKVEPIPGARRLHVTLETPAGVDVELAAIDAGGLAIAPVADAGKRGGVERLGDLPVPGGQAVYVRIKVKSGNNDTERYRLRWSAVPDEAAAVPVPGLE